MLTLAAANVMSNGADPFYTRLAAGTYQSKRPSGTPCDAVFPCDASGWKLGAKIAMGVIVGIVGLIIFVGVGYVLWAGR